ncbi:MAG: methyltransferase domain-containing protein [Rhodospirillaceae bacterium]|nr:methyltransferase domain-containing protein [Rhodospirillaceae bacterium]
MIDPLKQVFERRRSLRSRVQIKGRIQELHDSCIPSYCHPNWAASIVAWWRLFQARRLYKRFGTEGAVLDFGNGTGELGHLLGQDIEYHFVENDEEQLHILKQDLPYAVRHDTSAVPKNSFSFVFALDSLEHNENFPELIDLLVGSFKPGGQLLVCGPTENFLYRIGRAIAGFTGEQHVTNIYAIEKVLAEKLDKVAIKTVFFGLPLFRLSVWRGKQSA